MTPQEFHGDGGRGDANKPISSLGLVRERSDVRPIAFTPRACRTEVVEDRRECLPVLHVYSSSLWRDRRERARNGARREAWARGLLRAQQPSGKEDIHGD